MSLKVIIAGMGVQGSKRQHVAGKDVIATVDPFAPGVDYKDVRNVPLDAYEAALLCTPDEPKVEIIKYLLSNRKHVLVEKPLFSENDKDIEAIEKL